MWGDSKRAVAGVLGTRKPRLGIPWPPGQIQSPESAGRLMAVSLTSRHCMSMTLVLAHKVRHGPPFEASAQSEHYFVAFGRKVSLVSGYRWRCGGAT